MIFYRDAFQVTKPLVLQKTLQLSLKLTISKTSESSQLHRAQQKVHAPKNSGYFWTPGAAGLVSKEEH